MKIIKRDKSVEPFDISKITRVVKAAGLSEEQANELTRNVQAWVNQNCKNEVSAGPLREVVCKQLRFFNERAADLFEWYEKNKYKK